MSDTKKPYRSVPSVRTEPMGSPDRPRHANTIALDEDTPATVRNASHGALSPQDGAAPDLGATVKMHGAPRASSSLGVPRPSRLPNAGEGPPSGPVAGIELLVVDERQVGGGERRPWRAAEVWTKRRIYGLDSAFRCVEVLDRQTGRPELTHDMLGARLGGGRLREKDEVRFSYPLPLAGMEAMFSKGKKHGYTSPVERMLVRVRVLHTSPDEVAPTWEEIASRWSEAPRKP